MAHIIFLLDSAALNHWFSKCGPFSSVQFSRSVILTLCDTMDCSTPGKLDSGGRSHPSKPPPLAKKPLKERERKNRKDVVPDAPRSEQGPGGIY